jgi:hypothetical protein
MGSLDARGMIAANKSIAAWARRRLSQYLDCYTGVRPSRTGGWFYGFANRVSLIPSTTRVIAVAIEAIGTISASFHKPARGRGSTGAAPGEATAASGTRPADCIAGKTSNPVRPVGLVPAGIRTMTHDADMSAAEAVHRRYPGRSSGCRDAFNISGSTHVGARTAAIVELTRPACTIVLDPAAANRMRNSPYATRIPTFAAAPITQPRVVSSIGPEKMPSDPTNDRRKADHPYPTLSSAGSAIDAKNAAIATCPSRTETATDWRC